MPDIHGVCSFQFLYSYELKIAKRKNIHPLIKKRQNSLLQSFQTWIAFVIAAHLFTFVSFQTSSPNFLGFQYIDWFTKTFHDINLWNHDYTQRASVCSSLKKKLFLILKGLLLNFIQPYLNWARYMFLSFGTRTDPSTLVVDVAPQDKVDTCDIVAARVVDDTTWNKLRNWPRFRFFPGWLNWKKCPNLPQILASIWHFCVTLLYTTWFRRPVEVEHATNDGKANADSHGVLVVDHLIIPSLFKPVEN